MRLLTAAFCAAAGLLAVAATAQTTFTIDTQALQGQTGTLDFAFNPDTTSNPLNGSVTIDDFSGGSPGAVDTVDSANASGALPGAVTIDNSGAFNQLLQAYTFGSSFRFTANYTPAPTPGANGGNTLEVFLLDSGYNFFPTTDPSGNDLIATQYQNADGTLNGGQTYQVVPAPELSPALITGLLLLAGAGLASRQEPIAVQTARIRTRSDR